MALQLSTTAVPSLRRLDDLAWAIDHDGIERHAAEVAAVARSARRAGIDPVLTGVLLDAQLPAPVRERAFGQLAVSLAHAPAVVVAMAA